MNYREFWLLCVTLNNIASFIGVFVSTRVLDYLDETAYQNVSIVWYLILSNNLPGSTFDESFYLLLFGC